MLSSIVLEVRDPERIVDEILSDCGFSTVASPYLYLHATLRRYHQI